MVCVDGHCETLRVPNPGYYTYLTPANSEFGVAYYAVQQTGIGSCYGPRYKVYADPYSY